MQSNIFREYDIRGIVDKDFDDKDVNTLGKAIGTYLDAKGVRKITLGRDCRTHGPRIHKALLEACFPPAWKYWTSGSAPARFCTTACISSRLRAA